MIHTELNGWDLITPCCLVGETRYQKHHSFIIMEYWIGLDWIGWIGSMKAKNRHFVREDWLRYIRLIARGNNVCTGGAGLNMEHGVLLIWLESWEVFINSELFAFPAMSLDTSG